MYNEYLDLQTNHMTKWLGFIFRKLYIKAV